MALIPSHKEKGNKTERFSPEVKSLADKIIDEEFLTPQRPKVKRVYEIFCHKASELPSFSGGAALQIPSYKTFLSYTNAIDENTRIERQFGKLAARKQMKSSGLSLGFNSRLFPLIPALANGLPKRAFSAYSPK